MNPGIHLGKMMAFIRVDKKEIPRLNVIKTVVDEKLFAAGNGIIDLAAVMDMHVHRFIIMI